MISAASFRPMLVHGAQDEGIAAGENLAGQTDIVNHDVIPSTVHIPGDRRRRLTAEAAVPLAIFAARTTSFTAFDIDVTKCAVEIVLQTPHRCVEARSSNDR